MENIEIIKPDDFHVHLRQDELLKLTVRHCSDFFRRAIVMPNTIPPIASVETMEAYRAKIGSINSEFTPLMTFKLLKSLSIEDVVAMKEAGALAGKLYPAGSTTNSSDGIKDWREISELLSAMSDAGLVLSIHGEDPSVFSLDREKAYIPHILEISRRFPRLKIVFEHLSSAEGVNVVENGPDNLCGTITVQHLLLTLDDIVGGSLNPHNFCKPVLKRPEDREAIERVVLEGNRKFFFGSDSAPHKITQKEKHSGSAGCFSSPIALPMLADFFVKHEKRELLEGFVSRYGADFYGLEYNREKITLVKERWRVPDEFSGVKPLFAGTTIDWKIG